MAAGLADEDGVAPFLLYLLPLQFGAGGLPRFAVAVASGMSDGGSHLRRLNKREEAWTTKVAGILATMVERPRGWIGSRRACILHPFPLAVQELARTQCGDDLPHFRRVKILIP